MTTAIQDIFDKASKDIRSAIFGNACVFTPATGDPVPLNVNLVRGIDYEPGGMSSQTWGSEITIEYLLSDIGREVDQDEYFTMDADGAVYTVVKVNENDGVFCTVAVK